MVIVPTSYADSLRLLTNSPAPVVFVDTCIFLDIVRAPIREKISADIATHTQELCTRSKESPPSLWLVTSETVRDEWRAHIADVKAEVENEIQKLESKRKHFLSAAQFTTNLKFSYGQSETSLNLVSHLEAKSKALLDACLVVSPSDSHKIMAMNRIKKCLPPSRRGKAEPKDCEILELFLELCQGARAAGSPHKFVFVSSNVKDFGEDNSGGIQPELENMNANFVNHVAWAIAVIEGKLN